MSRFLLVFFSLTSVWAQQTGSPAVPSTEARPPDTETPFFLKQEITVTATRTELDATRSPVSVSTVSSQELTVRDIQTLDQALDTVTGVYPFRSKGYQDTLAGVGMRGFAGRGTGQSRTLVLLDGQPLNGPYTGQLVWTTLPVEEVERVEVVKGPFSALYGANAMGGVVHILTKPVDRRALDLRGEYGSQDTFRYALRAATRVRERLGVSLFYDRLQSGGYPSQFITTAGVPGTGAVPVTGFLPTLTTSGATTFIIGRSGDNWWKQQTWRLHGDYALNQRTSLAVQYIFQASNYGYDAYTSYLRTADGRVFDSGIGSITVAGSPRRLTVTPSMFLPGDGGDRSHLISAKFYRSLAVNARLRLGGGWIDAPLSYYSTPGSGSTVAGGPGLISDRPSRAWFGEAQWTWTPNGRHTLIAGADLRRDSASVFENNVPNYARRKEGSILSYAAGGKTFTQGEYIQHEWRPRERLMLVAGGRYDYWRTSGGRNWSASAALANDYSPRSHQSATGKAAVLYRAPGEVALRASLGNAYHSPTVYDLYRTWRSSTGITYASNPALKPEQVFAWEAGVSRRWPGSVDTDAVFFDNHVRDLIYRSTDFNTDPKGNYRPVVNAARAHIRGFEGSLRAPLRPWLFARAGYTWTLAEITRNPAIPESVGKRIPQVPEHNTFLGLFAVRRRWSASLTGRYVSAVFSTDTNTDRTKGVYGAFDPFFEADGSLTVEVTRRAALSLSAQNLLDRVYFNYYPVPGRMVFIGVRIRL